MQNESDAQHICPNCESIKQIISAFETTTELGILCPICSTAKLTRKLYSSSHCESTNMYILTSIFICENKHTFSFIQFGRNASYYSVLGIYFFIVIYG